VSDNSCRDLGFPEPQSPPWEWGEIDEDGNRYWIINFVKYVEFVPEWQKPYFEFNRVLPPNSTKWHPLKVSVGVLDVHVGGHIYRQYPPANLNQSRSMAQKQQSKTSPADHFSDDEMEQVKRYGQALGGQPTDFDEEVEREIEKRQRAREASPKR